MKKQSASAPKESGFGILAWVVASTIAGAFVTFLWILSAVFVAMGYMKRTGHERAYYLWVLHLCSLVVVLRVVGYFHMLFLVGHTPPDITSREQFRADYGVLAWLALPDWRFAEAAIGERADSLIGLHDVGPETIDPFSGQPLRTVRTGNRLEFYSIGPDQIDQQLAIRYDKRQGVFSPGDIPVAVHLVADDVTTPTLEGSRP